MRRTFLQIKLKTTDDHVRTCLFDLEQVGDAATLEKHYHRNCLQYAKRTCTQIQYDDETVILSLCDEEFIIIVRNTLVGDNMSMTMAELND